MRLAGSRDGSVLAAMVWIMMLGTSVVTRAHARQDHAEAEVMANGDSSIPMAEGHAVICDCTAQVAAKDCSPAVEAAVHPLMVTQHDLEKKLAASNDELDEIIIERNSLLEQIKQFRESLHSSRSEQESLRNTVQSTKDAKDEIQQRLLTCQSQLSTLKNELNTAQKEIRRLNNLSFIVQFRSEVMGLFDSMVDFAKNLVRRN